MASINIEIGDGPTRLLTHISSWFAKDVQKLTGQFLGKIENIAVKDLVDMRVGELMRVHVNEIAKLNDKVIEWRERALKAEGR